MNVYAHARFSDSEKDDIRARVTLSSVFERCGVRLKRAGKVQMCLCPAHTEKTPSCMIDDAKGVYFCHGCSEGGDVFDAVQKLRGCTFPEAVEWLGGTRELTEIDLARIEKRNRDREEQAQADRARSAAQIERTWAASQPIARTHAHAYLEARGLNPIGCTDLRFVPALAYWGYASVEAQEATHLGDFPAMVAAIRSPAGQIIGVHRTYLDRAEPVKLRPPGDTDRNRAKKIAGEARGGAIALTKASRWMAYGEGIETTLSWRILSGAASDGFGLAALVSISNICGSATGSIEHPSKRHPDGRPLLVPNGIPDYDAPGFMPGLDVERALLLGDGDSDTVSTRLRLLTAYRRWTRDPNRFEPLHVGIEMAADGADFNDMLMREAEL